MRMRQLFLVLFLVFAVGCGWKSRPPSRQVNFLVWSAYVPGSIMIEFEKTTGIHVNYDFFDTNEAVLEKLQSGVSNYDVIVASDYMIRILNQQKLLHAMDLKQIPNVKNIDPKFLHLPYDRQNEYSVPFLWSTSGIGYNKTKVTDTVDSWAILWNPKYKEKICMLDDERETFGAALKLRGHSINSSSSADWDDAKDLLTMQKPLLKAYNSTNFDELLLSGDVWLAHAWSGNMVIAMNQNPQLGYVVPKEGSVMSIDNFAIPANSSHLQEAAAFINFCLDAKIGAEITNFNSYPNTNAAAKAFIKPEILDNKISYPDPATMARCELMQSLGDLNQKIDRYWTEIKSR